MNPAIYNRQITELESKLSESKKEVQHLKNEIYEKDHALRLMAEQINKDEMQKTIAKLNTQVMQQADQIFKQNKHIRDLGSNAEFYKCEYLKLAKHNKQLPAGVQV